MTVREIALSLLLEYENSGKYVNLSLSSHKADSLSPKERAFLTVLLYTAVERKLTYDYIISALSSRSASDISPRARGILRLGLCQLMHIDSVPPFAAVNETVKLAGSKGERAFVNAVLREAQRRIDSLPMPERAKNPARYLSVYYSVPLPTVKHLVRMLGEDGAEDFLRTVNTVPPTTLTVNTLRITRDEFIKELARTGVAAQRTENSEISVKIDASANPCELFGYKEGLFFVQDEASAIAVSALGATKGDIIIDVCACPGGKSFAASVLSGGTPVFAFDLYESKLSLVKDGSKRLGLEINAAVRDARLPDESLLEKADRVICDVPCSGLGVLAKKPDLRYKDLDSLSELPDLQLEILTASSRYLKTGGEMIYSTCTLGEAENADVVNKFLSENRDFKLVPFTVGTLRAEDGMLTLYPHVHGTDGFFIAKIKRL